MRPLLVYALAAVITTWPLAIHPASLLGAPVGAGDPYLNLWILGWGMQAWLLNPLSVLQGAVFDANIFHPAAGTLAYSDHLLLQSAAMAPLYLLSDHAVLCYNVLLLVSLVGSALAMHLFVARVIGTSGGAYVAGLAWGFGSYRFAHLIHLQLQALYFLPLTFLFLHRLIAARRKRDAVALGLLTGLQAIASVYYAVIGGLGLVIGGVVLAGMSSRRGATRVASRLALAAVVAAALALPVGVVYWRVQQAEGFGRNLFEAERSAAFADSYLQAPAGNVVYGRTGLLRHAAGADTQGLPHTGAERELFPGFALIALALAGAWLGWRADARPVVATMIAVGLAGFVLSLGPDGIRDVYATLHRYVFGFQAIRAPARFSVLVMFALATLAALGWRELSSGAHRGAPPPPRTSAPPPLRTYISRAALALVALELLHVPTTLVAAPAPRTSVGQWLRQAEGNGAVAVLPLGLDIDNTPAMVQSLEHRRPILNGYSGQRPSFYAPLVEAVSAFPADEALLALHESGVQYVVASAAVTRPAGVEEWPLVPRAHFAAGTIYELVWTPAIEERLGRLASVVPPEPGRIPFATGETSHYDVRWDGAGLNVVAGEVVLSVEAPSHRLVATAATAPWVARFFEARDRFVTTADARLRPLVHEREQNEGARHVTRAYVYDWQEGVVRTGVTAEAARAAGAVALPLVPEARDAISALFYLRTLSLEPGTTLRFPVNEAGRNLVVEVAVAGREVLTIGGQAIETIKLEPRMLQRVQRRAPVSATVWVTVDERRLPVRADVAAGFGRITMELNRYVR